MGLFNKNSKTRTSSYDSYREVLEKIIIEKDGYLAINPAIYYFILYNPITGLERKNAKLNKNFLLENVSQEDYIDFLELEKKIIDIYENKVFSKMSKYLNSILKAQFTFSMGIESHNLENFKKVTKGSLRKIINEQLYFNCNEEFKSELETQYPDMITELNNGYNDSNSKEVYYYYSKEYKILFMFRKKTKESVISKFDELFNKLDSDKQESFIELATYILAYSRRLFEGNHYQELYNLTKNKNDSNYFLPRQDIYAVRLIRLNQKQSLEDLKIANNLRENQMGFYFIKLDMKDDHRNRTLQNRPGGIHHTYIDTSFLNYGFEFQFLDFKSLIFTYFGETKDSFKNLRK